MRYNEMKWGWPRNCWIKPPERMLYNYVMWLFETQFVGVEYFRLQEEGE